MSQGEFRTIRELLDRFNLLKDTRYSLMDRENTARELIGRRQNLLEGLTSVIEIDDQILYLLIPGLCPKVNNGNFIIHRSRGMSPSCSTITFLSSPRSWRI